MYKNSLTRKLIGWVFCVVFSPVMAAHQHESSNQAATAEQHLPLSVHNASVISSQYSSQGRLWIAWVLGSHVYVNYSDDDAKTFSTAVKVNVQAEIIAAHGESRPKITIANNGNIYIAYTQKLANRYSGNIRFSRSIDGGKHFSSPITINSDLDIISHRFEAMVVNPQGYIYLSWLDARDAERAKRNKQAYVGSALYSAVSTDFGISFQRNIKIQDHSCQCCRIAMDTDVHGSPVVVWRQIFDKKYRDHALIRLLTPTVWGQAYATSPSRIGNDNWMLDACPHHGPALSIAADDIYHLTWFTGATDRQGLHYAQSSNQGRSFNNQFHFAFKQQQAQHADIHSFGADVFIVWKEFDGTQSTLKLIHSTNHGKNWSDAQTLASATGPTDYPFFVVKQTALRVAWLGKSNGLKMINIARTSHEPAN